MEVEVDLDEEFLKEVSAEAEARQVAVSAMTEAALRVYLARISKTNE